MSVYDAKDGAVQNRSLKVQTLVIPLSITANATPANKVVSNDEPALLFINVQGIVGISTGTGALAVGETAPTLATATDSTGVINVAIKISEPLSKVCMVRLISRSATATLVPGQVLALSTGTGGGQTIFANFTTGVNLASASIDAAIEVAYITTK